MNPRSAGVSPARSPDAGETPALRFAGLVLAGGRSTRFGGEKAVAHLRGKPLMLWCADALRGVCETVAINARPGSEAAALAKSLDFDVLYDNPAHPAGPLAGVAAGLAWAKARGFDGVVTLPCDTPLVRPDDLGRLITALNEGGRPAAHAVADGRAQGLCAVWRADLCEPLNARLDAGDHPAVHRWLEELGAAPVAFADAARFRNINTRQDLGALETA